MTIGRATIRGGLPRAWLKRKLRAPRLRAGMLRCYTKRIPHKGPFPKGIVLVQLVLSSKGTIMTARIKKTSLKRPAVEACLKRQLQTIRFAPRHYHVNLIDVPIRFPGSHTAAPPPKKRL